MAADLAAAGVPPAADESVAEVLAQPSPLAAFWAAFRENRGAVFGLAVFGLIVVLALAANVVAPYSPIEQFRDAVRAPPVWETGGSWRFVLGTDGDGHDMLSRLIYGARVSLFIGFSVMCVSFVIGAALGLLAAMTGPVVDVAVTRLMDLIMAVPSLVLAILVVAVLGPSLANTIVAVTIVYLPRYVRLVRASALGELNKDYVTAARVAGVGPFRLAWSTVLPNCLAPLIVMAALGVSDAILEAAGLGFLGLGAQPPTPEWGSMLADFARIHPLQSLDRHASGPRDPDHRRRDQPRRRRPARRARPEHAEGMRGLRASRRARSVIPAKADAGGCQRRTRTCCLRETGSKAGSSGKTMKDVIFDPLGMYDTAFKIGEAQRKRLAKIHARTPEGLVATDTEIPQEPEFEMGGAGLYGTVGDYLKFAQVFLHDGTFNGVQILKPETVKLMGQNAAGEVRVRAMKSAQPPIFQPRRLPRRHAMGPQLPHQPGAAADWTLRRLAGLGGFGEFLLLDRSRKGRGRRLRDADFAVLRREVRADVPGVRDGGVSGDLDLRCRAGG